MFDVVSSNYIALVIGSFGLYFSRVLDAGRLGADNRWLPTQPMASSEDSTRPQCLLFSKDQTPPDVALTSPKAPYSHSIINERCELLIGKPPDAASQIFTVIFTVNLSGTSIGGGLRAIRRKLTFRDLSRSIDSWGARERFASPRRDPRSAPALKVHPG